jgi:ABC-type nickel/cobalt efflux system permease component RcnA
MALLVGISPCHAHPSDEAAVFHYLWIEARPGEVSLQQATVVGGLLTQAVWPQLDPDGNHQLSSEEQQRRARELAAGLSLEVDGKPVRWSLAAYEFPSYEEFFGGSFPAVKLLLKAPLPQARSSGSAIRVRDETYPRYKGVFPRPVIRPTGLSASEPQVSEDGRQTEVRLSSMGSRQSAVGSKQPAGDGGQKAVSKPGPITTPRLRGADLQHPTSNPEPATPPNPLPRQAAGAGHSPGQVSGAGSQPPTPEHLNTRTPNTHLPGLSLDGGLGPRPKLPGPANGKQPGKKAVAGEIRPPRLKGVDLNKAPLFPENARVVYAAPERARSAPAGKLRGLLGRRLTLGEILLGLLAALLAGAAHALTPGHGKAMVGAYLVGSRGTVWDAVLLGLVVTITHTAGVYLLGFVCLWLATRIQAEVVGQWLSLISGVLGMGMGFWLFQRGLLAYHGVRPLPGHGHGEGGHVHSHAEASASGDPSELAHAPSHGHSHARGHEHSYAAGHSHEGAALSVAGGTASGRTDRERRPPSDSPLEECEAGADRPVAAPRGLRDRWGIIGLGIAGGMVPCFDALAILIAAVNLGSIALGLALIAAFSVGMAAVLVLIGVLMVTAKGLAARFSGERRWIKALPAVSGAVLFFLGAWLTLQALAEAGVVRVG